MSTIAPKWDAPPRAEVGAPSSMIEDLIALQSDLPVVLKDSENPHFRNKYASLHALHKAVFPILAKHGFAWVTLPHCKDGMVALSYSLTHRSGDEIGGAYPLPEGLDPQKLGSAITYARRYSLCAVLGLVADEDDDGQAASSTQRDTASANAISEAVAETFPGSTVSTTPKTCPKCGKALKERNGKKGAFLGCSGYPACTFTRDIAPEPFYDPTEIPM